MASPPDLDRRLRAAAGPEPDAEEALSDVMQRIRRRTRRRAAVAVATLAVAAGVVVAVRGAGQDSGGADVAVQTDAPADTDAPSDTPDDTDPSAVPGPRFHPAPGWEISRPGLTAANVPLGPDSLAGQVPWDTVERLEEGDVVLFAMLVPVGDSAAVDAIFPPRELPLSLDDAEPGGLEGQPDDVYADRLAAQVDRWNIDLLVFYGGADPVGDPSAPASPPTDEIRAEAQEQLERLMLPDR